MSCDSAPLEACGGAGLRAGECGAAAAGLGAGQGVQGVLLGWGRREGERQQGERWAEQAPGEGVFLLDGVKEKGFVDLGVLGSCRRSSSSMGVSSGFFCTYQG